MVPDNKNTFNSPERAIAQQEFQTYMTAKALLDEFGIHAEDAAAIGTFCNFEIAVDDKLVSMLFTGRNTSLPAASPTAIEVKTFRINSNETDEVTMQQDIHLGFIAQVGSTPDVKEWSLDIFISPETPSKINELVIEGIKLNLGEPRCDLPRLIAANNILGQARQGFDQGVLVNKGPGS